MAQSSTLETAPQRVAPSDSIEDLLKSLPQSPADQSPASESFVQAMSGPFEGAEITPRSTSAQRFISGLVWLAYAIAVLGVLRLMWAVAEELSRSLH